MATAVTEPLDRRLHAYRPDLADRALEDKIHASRFVSPALAHIVQPVANVHAEPNETSGMDTQFIYGESIKIFDRQNGWAWVQSERDSYVGYIHEDALSKQPFDASHIVIVPRSFTYPGPDLKFPHRRAHSMGAIMKVLGEETVRGTTYALLENGEAMIAHHLRPLSQAPQTDYVTIAETFLHTPYLWGGKSGFGLDCSGLLQLSLLMTGTNVLRDTDQQAGSIGTEIDLDIKHYRRGDLIFWRGHVAIVTGPNQIIHASGHTMTVTSEPLDQAIQRIEPFYGKPIMARRPT